MILMISESIERTMLPMTTTPARRKLRRRRIPKEAEAEEIDPRSSLRASTLK
jgi:uncharacterized protein with von Willebrand factor type A (vWA) domain